MKLPVFFSSVVAVLLSAGCSQKHTWDCFLLDCLPSDASVIVCADKLGEGLETIFEPDDVFRDLVQGRLADEPAVVSFHYSGTLIPLLAVAYGRPSGKVPGAISSFESSAESLGLKTLYLPAEPNTRRKNVLLVCESESILSAASRHVEEGASILEVPGMAEALSDVKPAGVTAVLHNGSCSQFMDKNFLAPYVRRSAVLSFVSSFSEWSVLRLEKSTPLGKGEVRTFSLDPVGGPGMALYSNVLASLPPASSRLGDMIPYGTTYIVDMPIASVSLTVESRRQWLDVTGGLNRFNNFNRTHRTSEGWDCVRWAEEIQLREAARLWCRGEELLLLRCGKVPGLDGVSVCPWTGFAANLLGGAFSLADEKSCAVVGDWIVIGSAKAVAHYLQKSSKKALREWPVRNAKAAVLADDMLISCGEDGIKLEIYKSY